MKIEDLGERAIEGFRCRGQRVLYGDGTTETWWDVAHSLDRPLLRRSLTANEEYEARLFNIRRREPDSTLFAALER